MISRRVRSLWRNLVHRGRVDRELDDELRAALDLLVDEHLRAGMSLDEARRAAMLTLGGIEPVKQQVRDVRSGAFIDTLVQDVRHGTRILVHNPFFTLTAVASIALGIGATTAIFTVANGLLLRPAAGVRDPGSLVDIVRMERGGGPVSPISYPEYIDLRTRTTTIEDLYAYQLMLEPSGMRVGDGGAERVYPTAVSTNFLDALGVRPAAGRLFTRSDDEQAGASPIAVLSHRFWSRRFARDAGIIGQTIRINGHPLTVIGIASEGFTGTSVTAPDLWVPLGMIAVTRPEEGSHLMTSRRAGWLMAGARLKPEVSQAQASAEIATIGRELEREFPGSSQPPPGVSMEGLVDRPFGGFVWSVETASPIPYGLRVLVAGFLTLLMVLVSVVLVIACANLAGVLLARGTTRRREMAVRVASGAARGRLIRQLLTETAVLFGLGGLAGLVLARWLTSLLVSLLPAFPVPIAVSVPLDQRVVAFSLVLSFAAAVVAGLAPALRASRSDVVSALKDDAHGTPERPRLRHAFVVAQVAFSLLLVITAGLFVRALESVRNIDRGFDAEAVDTVSLDLSMAGYTAATGSQLAHDLIERVRALPGVVSAAIADPPPGAGARMLGGVSVPGVVPPPGMTHFTLSWTASSPDYFRTLRIPILDGRDFTAADSAGAEPVVILGRRAVERFWPGRSGVGQFIVLHSIGPGAQNMPPVRMRVIGVARDVSPSGRPEAYVPLQQHYWPTLTILARRDPSRSAAGELRDLAATVDPDLPVLSAQPLDSLSNGPVETQLRVAAAVAAAVGLIGLMLAAVGIYGVTAYSVTRRTREIGVRLSLGARRSDVVRLVLGQGMTLVAIGIAIGLILGMATGRLVMGSGFGPGVNVPPFDPSTFLAATALFAIVGLVACYAPLRRAVRVQAADALRYE